MVQEVVQTEIVNNIPEGFDNLFHYLSKIAYPLTLCSVCTIVYDCVFVFVIMYERLSVYLQIYRVSRDLGDTRHSLLSYSVSFAISIKKTYHK